MEKLTQAQRTALSDERMLDAAEALILELGTQATTLKGVGERAGYSRGLAQARFGSKEVLFLRLTERSLEKWVNEVRQAAGNAKGLRALRSRVRAISVFTLNHPDAARVLYVLWFESVGFPSPMRDGLARFHDRGRRDIAELVLEAKNMKEIGKSVDAELFALQFTSTFFGACYQWLVNADAVDLAWSAERMGKTLLMQLKSA